MKNILTVIIAIAFIFKPHTLSAIQKADEVVVKKSEKKLYLLKDGKKFATFSVVFGGNPKGPKTQKNDKKTPEGVYLLKSKNDTTTDFYKSISIDYPNDADRAQAKARGVETGGDVLIHGQKNGMEWLTFLAQKTNWTKGCIALTNKDMDKIWIAVDPNTRITIYP